MPDAPRPFGNRALKAVPNSIVNKYVTATITL